MRADKEQLQQQQKLLGIEKEKLEQVALQVNQRSKEVDDMSVVSTGMWFMHKFV